jgi:Divergent InlB B-repeat domain
LGAPVPTIDLTVFLNTSITSRLLPNGPSEVLLVVDEPGVGPNTSSTILACAGPNGICAINGTGSGAGTYDGSPGRPNVFQGVVTGNSVTFPSVPFDPPAASSARILRITNIRVNAVPLSGGSGPAIPVIASLSVSGATGLSLLNPNPTVGFVQPSLIAGASATTSLSQCSVQTRTAVSTLSFTEAFGTAFKTRVIAQRDTAYAGQTFPLLDQQNVPGTIYFSASNFVAAVPNGTAGLADYGTRLKATFQNVPAGVRIYVSVYNVVNDSAGVPIPSVLGGSTANSAATGFAQLVTTETAGDGIAPNSFPAVNPTNLAPGMAGSVPVVEIPIISGSGSAVWEVINTNPNRIETLQFAIYASYVPVPGANLPLPGTATVTTSFAAAPPAFPVAAGPVASSSLPLPRYVAGSFAANFLTINACPVAVTVNTSPAGLPVIVDGQGVTAPRTFSWIPGSTHSLEAVSPQPIGTGSRYAFANWSNGGTISQNVVVPSTDTTYAATYSQQFQLTTNVSPAGSGSITAGGWIDAGTVLSVGASANSGFQFANFSDGLTGSSNPQNLTMDAPKNVVANFSSLAPILGATITARSGVPGARQWTITLANNGQGVANSAQIDALTVTQTAGVACSTAPAITSPSPAPSIANPLAVGTLSPGASGSAAVSLDFSGCAASARFRVGISFRANGGAYTGSATLNNQFY